jgi:hypothetical protein
MPCELRAESCAPASLSNIPTYIVCAVLAGYESVDAHGFSLPGTPLNPE